MTDPALNRPEADAVRAASPRRLDAAWRAAAQALKAAGAPSAGLDARLLLAHACALSHEALVAQPERALSRREHDRFARLLRRRMAREPVSRILGRRSFWRHDFAISPETLDPRPDTEIVVETALALTAENAIADGAPAIADLGTGSGCILLSVLGELPNAWGVGCDLSAPALAQARANARALGLEGRAAFVRAAWLAGLAGAFDLVVANPPYVPSGEIGALSPEVARHDPRLALDGGRDGLDAYRAIIPSLRRVLRPAGWAVLEVGQGQAAPVRRLLADAGFRTEGRGYRENADLGGRIRCVAAMQR